MIEIHINGTVWSPDFAQFCADIVHATRVEAELERVKAKEARLAAQRAILEAKIRRLRRLPEPKRRPSAAELIGRILRVAHEAEEEAGT